MNTVTPNGVRAVDTTVGELKPGTLFRPVGSARWSIKTDEDDSSICCLPDGMLRYGFDHYAVVEIADSITITKETTGAKQC